MIQPLVTLALAKAATTGTNWPAVAALAAWATVLIYIVIGLFAWRQVREARKLREEQARPFVIVDFEPGFLVYLTVENLGRTLARDVTIRFNKPLDSTLPEPHDFDESPIFRGEPIPVLPPGKQVRVLFDLEPLQEKQAHLGMGAQFSEHTFGLAGRLFARRQPAGPGGFKEFCVG